MIRQPKLTSRKHSKSAPGKKKTAGEKATPLPPKVRKALSTVNHCRAELASVYREARAGRLDVANASKFANILAILSRMIEGSDLEKRLCEIEKMLTEGGPNDRS